MIDVGIDDYLGEDVIEGVERFVASTTEGSAARCNCLCEIINRFSDELAFELLFLD